jgi:parallel beta-helix repeat protein
MKKVRTRSVRAVAAIALVGTLFGVAAQSASATPRPIKVFVRTNGSDSHTCLGASAAHACLSISHAVSVADHIDGAESTPGSIPVIVEVRAGTYFDTTTNTPSGPATSPPGISITEPNVSITRKGGGTVTIEPVTTQAETSVEDTTPQNVLVNVAPGVSGADLSKLTITGIDAQNSFTPGSQDFVGVYFPNASGSLDKVTVTGIQQPAHSFGDQPGANGDIYAVSCTGGSCPASTGSSSVTLTDVTATNYDKNGITCDGAATSCTISGSTVTGGGGVAGTPPLSDQAQNGIQVAYGATATVTTTTVSGNAYSCNGVLNSACYSASGILGYQDGGLSVTHSTVTANDVGIVPYDDAGAVTISNNTVTDGTDASVGSAQGIEPVDDGSTFPVTVSDNTVTGDDGGGIYNYETGSLLSASGNTVENNSASEDICTVAGPPISGCTTEEVGGGITNDATTGGTVSGNTIENNAAGGVIDAGSTGGTVGPTNTISNNAAGGVLLQSATGATVSDDTLSGNTAAGVLATSSNDQSSGDTVSGNTFGGTSSAGVELEETGGFTISGNTVTTGDSGPGFLLVDSSGSSISTNTVSDSEVGVYLGGNDLTGPSTGNNVDNNLMSDNELGGAAADGFGSPETWNAPGSPNQGIQGEVFFQSDQTVAAGKTSGGTGRPQKIVTPTGFTRYPGAFAGVAEYLASAGDICGTGSVAVDNQGGSLAACTDGTGDIFIEGTVGTEILVGNGAATGPSTTSEPGCEANPPSSDGEPTCVGTVLTLSGLSSVDTVASGNTFDSNVWADATVAGAIDGSGPNGQYTSASAPFVDDDPGSPVGLQNTWTNNAGSPANSSANPTTADPAAGT